MTNSLAGKFKELLSHSAIYGIGSVLQSLLAFLLIPVYTKNLTAEQYGIWALLISCATIAGVVFYLGVSSALARSFYDYTDLEERKRVVNTSLVLTSGGAVLQIALGVLFGAEISTALFGSADYALHVRIALAGSAFGFINQLFYVVLRFQRRSKTVVILNLVSLVTGGALIIYLLLVQRLGVMAPVLGEALNQLFLCVALAYAAREWLGRSISAHEVKVQLLYGLPTVANGLIYYLYTMGDRFLIQRFCELSDVGVYALGARIGMLIQVVLILPFAQIWTPVRLEIREKPAAAEFFARILTYYVLVGVLVALALTVFSSEIVALLGRKPEYEAASRVVPLVGFAHLLYGMVPLLDAGIIFSRRTYLTTFVAALALATNVVTNVVLLPRLGIPGAGVALIISMAIFAFGTFLVSRRLFPIIIEYKRVFTAAGVFLLFIFATFAIDSTISVRTLLIKASVFAAAVACLVRFVLNCEERTAIAQTMQGAWVRIRHSETG